MQALKHLSNKNWFSIIDRVPVYAEHLNAVIDRVNLLSGTTLIPTAIDCSASPNYPAAYANQIFYVSVAGLIGGGAGTAVEAGDIVIALVDSVGGTQAAVGSQFTIVQKNMIPCTTTVLYAGTNNTDFVSAKTLADAGCTYSAATRLAIAGGTTQQLSLTTTAAAKALNITATAMTVNVIDIMASVNSTTVDGISVTMSNSASLSGGEYSTAYKANISNLAADADTSAVFGLVVSSTGVTGSRADVVCVSPVLMGVLDTADTHNGVFIVHMATMNNASADTYGVRISTIPFTHTNGNYHGVLLEMPNNPAAGEAFAFQGILDSAERSNAKYGVHISKDLTNSTAVGALSVTNEAIVAGQIVVTSGAASGASTVNNNMVNFVKANRTEVALADVYGGSVQVISYTAATSVAGTATNSATGLLVDYNLTETAGTLSATAFNVVDIDFDITGTPDFAAGSYNLLSVSGASNASPAYTAGSLVSGINIDLSGMIVTDADLSLTGLKITLPAPGASSQSAVSFTNGTLATAMITGGSVLSIVGTATNIASITTAASITNLLAADAVGGFIIANALVPAAAPDAGTMGADACIRILIGATPYYIPLYDTLHA